MTTNHDWTYYQYDCLTGAYPMVFFRRLGGIVGRLDRKTKTWVSLDSDLISHYLEKGEMGLDETTRAKIEATLGSPRRTETSRRP